MQTLELIRQILEDTQIREKLETASDQHAAAKILAGAAVAKGHKANVEDIMKALSEIPSVKPGQLTEAELHSVAGGLRASGDYPTTLHTSCCSHCITQSKALVVCG